MPVRRISRVTVAGMAVVGVVGAGLVAIGWDQVVETFIHLPERVAARFVPAAPGEVLPVAQELGGEIAGLARRVDGRIVWSSNRDGNHDLYLLELGNGEVRRLTDDPHVDYFSRFSPDGARIVFLRSRPMYVSGRDPDRWDVWIVDADGGNERRVARRGFRPTWTLDGSAVLFSRGREIFRVDPASGREARIFAPGADFPAHRPDGIYPYADEARIGVMRRGGGSSVLFLDGSKPLQVTEGHSCQVTWYPQLQKMTWISGEDGNGGNAVMWSGPDPTDADVLIDLPGPRSHEYFPRLSPDGRWLVWAATEEGHEHDRADYEIYLWELGTPWDEAIRVTHYTGNDQWPDLWVRPRSD